MKKTKAIDAYDDVAHREIFDLTTPESLVLKLVEKSCILLASCVENLDQSQDEAFQQTSLHALQIILSLRFVLDTNNSYPLAMDFYDTYTAIAASLVRARADRNKASLGKIYLAMEELRDAWRVVDSRIERSDHK